jgi:hypothetical protein
MYKHSKNSSNGDLGHENNLNSLSVNASITELTNLGIP